MNEFIIEFDKAAANKQHIEDLLSYLQKTEKRIYVYGCGVYGRLLRDYLGKRSIYTDYVVDDEYFSDECEGISLSELPSKSSYIIIDGINDGFTKEHDDRIGRLTHLISKSRNSEFIPFHQYWLSEYNIMTALIDETFLKDNLSQFYDTYALLEDQLSKDVMKAYLYAGISFDSSGLGKLVTEREHDYELGLLFSKQKEGIIIECGAFDGKSVKEIADYTGNRYTILAMECDTDNLERLQINTKNNPNIQIVPKGAWNKNTRLTMIMRGESSYLIDIGIESKGEGVEVTDIDSLFENVEGDRTIQTIIMDIEGSELKALEGAQKTIRAGKTNLAVRVYHKQEDLITIPQYIRKLNNHYRFYLRKNQGASLSRTGTETTLYAILD